LKVLVTGAGGLVGRAVSEYCANSGDEVLSYAHRNLDITSHDGVREAIVGIQPDVVINCAAWTDVDGSETNQDKAFAVNAVGPEILATVCGEVNCVFITISTDYVFDGKKSGFYTQRDKPNPESVYAESKLEGERRSSMTYDGSIIVRTGYVFGCGGTNFLSTVVDRVRKGEKLKAISDMYGSPTYSRDLAERLRQLAELNIAGIYHVVNSGPGVSFEQFTLKAVELIGNRNAVVESVSAATLNRPAKRPRNSRLHCLLTEEVGLPQLRIWESALEEFVQLEVNKERNQSQSL
jgi:dTDP-4-dehydrorhamnose reductase